MWNCVMNTNDISDLMEKTHYFHDSCIKEMKYISGAFVDQDLSMFPTNNQRILSVIIQSQLEECPVIELEFAKLVYIKMYPNDENYTSEILDANLFVKQELFYWCDNGDITYDSIDEYHGTIICSKNLRWRIIDNRLGCKPIYDVLL